MFNKKDAEKKGTGKGTVRKERKYLLKEEGNALVLTFIKDI